MAQPVNLNRFKKDKARAEKTARATQNVAKFGRSKAEKTLERAKTDMARRDLDGHRGEE